MMKAGTWLARAARAFMIETRSSRERLMHSRESSRAVADYWTRHNVTLHRRFSTPEESLRYLAWRNDQYFGYAERMPVDGQDGKVVLDYGCGPGHDLVGFGVHSRPSRLIGCDVSSSSLDEARQRLALHGIACDIILLDPSAPRIPLEDDSVDHIHCSGVLHHTVDPVTVLAEFKRILRPGGVARIMVYNYDSVWLHYYVAYEKLVQEQKYADTDIREAFSRTTDGEDCPIARVYRSAEFAELAAQAGWRCEFVGAAISAFEASLLPGRYKAIMDERLREESRRFLVGLEFDARGLPMHQGRYAGIDGCYVLRSA